MDNSNDLAIHLSRCKEHCLSSINSNGTDPALPVRLENKSNGIDLVSVFW